MSETSDFQDLVRRVREGEMGAAAALVQQYEPMVRRAVRLRMLSPSMRRTMDSMDICQSVLGSFFVRAAMGQYELNTPEDLVKLLVRLARNKVAGVARKHFARKRDARRVQDSNSAIDRVMDQQETPSKAVEGADLLEHFRMKLSPEERALADQRAQGREWVDIAKDMNESPEALRKRLQRAVDRAARELGLDDAEVADE